MSEVDADLLQDRERGLMNGFEFILREKLERRERQRQAALTAFARVSAAQPLRSRALAGGRGARRGG